LTFNVKGKKIVAHRLTKPNFNIVDYVFNEEGNKDLAQMNDLNEAFFKEASFEEGGLYDNEFITSHSIFSAGDYGSSPLNFVERMGFGIEQWQKVGALTVLRACCMSTYMYDKDCFDEYSGRIKDAIQRKLETVYGKY
jgi:hypothetical protein